jgi:hypothetical protein
VPGFRAESSRERALARAPELLEGLAWGAPRFGHPEGRVGVHVAQILARIERDGPLRADLRLVALLHDSFKYLVQPGLPYTPENDHAVLARRFAERVCEDERVLETIERHDEPYWIWHNSGGDPRALEAILGRIPDRTLYLRFVQLDAATEGKDASLLAWLRHVLGARSLWPTGATAPGLELATSSPPELVYLELLGTDAADQAAVAAAVAGRPCGASAVDVLASDDGTRIAILGHWPGSAMAHLLAEGETSRRAFQDHPVLRRARPLEAHVFRHVGHAVAGAPAA